MQFPIYATHLNLFDYMARFSKENLMNSLQLRIKNNLIIAFKIPITSCFTLLFTYNNNYSFIISKNREDYIFFSSLFDLHIYDSIIRNCYYRKKKENVELKKFKEKHLLHAYFWI